MSEIDVLNESIRKLNNEKNDLTNKIEQLEKKLEQYETVKNKEEVTQLFDDPTVKMEFAGFRDNLQKVIVDSVLELENNFQDLITEANMVNKECVDVRNKDIINPSNLTTETVSSFTNTNSNLQENFLRDRVPEVVRENFPKDNIPSHSRKFRDHEMVNTINNLKTQNEKVKNNIEGTILSSSNKYFISNQNYGAPLSTFNLKTNNPNFYPLNR